MSEADENRRVVPVGIRPTEAGRRQFSPIVWSLPGPFALKLGDRVWVGAAGPEWLGEVVVPSEQLVEWPDVGADQAPQVVRRASDDEWPKPPDTAGRRLLASLDLPAR